MKLSTKGRYAVMALLNLAEIQKENSAPVNLKEIAKNQDLSLSYLEQLFAKLRKAGVVKSVRGPGGGYLLARNPNNIWLIQITDAVHEETDMSKCGSEGLPNGTPCIHGGGQRCNAHHLWIALTSHIKLFLQTVSLQMVLDGKINPDFVMPEMKVVQDTKVKIS